MNNLENPFSTFDKIHEIIVSSCDIICVDFHAEATSEKIAAKAATLTTTTSLAFALSIMTRFIEPIPFLAVFCGIFTGLPRKHYL